MGKHFFGIKEGNYRARFFKEYSDEEFYDLVLNDLGGDLPRGVFAWHLEDGEDIHNSKRVQAIAKLPIVTGAFGNWLDPSEYLPGLMEEQARERLYKLTH
ncbi:hypothetical protein P4H94_04505 [Paenibacillus macerans]|uniref:hypothetical protein n=1 Tax=Paenibacillus macerans TaxID=44252 RepID=UPI002DB70EC2|nr:hypothetical protein [Paenibacillus macerans]MEC0136149.1 hypothetical protein [Paenibacillus macerans]